MSRDSLHDPLRDQTDSAAKQEEPLPLLEYMQLLWFRRWTVIAITVLTAVIGWVWVNQQTPLYRASSTLIMGSTMSGVTTPEMMMLRVASQHSVTDEIQVFLSRSLAETVVEELDLLSYPEFNPAIRTKEPEPGLFDWFQPVEWIPDSWKESAQAVMQGEQQEANIENSIERDKARRQIVVAASILQGGLDVSNEDFSNVVRVSFRSSSPKIAAMIANELPEIYMLSTLQAKYDSTEKSTKWLSEQLSELRMEVETAERAVELYRAEHGLTDIGGSDLITEQVSTLNSQLVIARAERAEAEARLRQVQQLLMQDEAAAEAATRLSGSTLIQQLRTQEIEAQRSVSDLAVEYGPKHPRMIQAQAEVRQISDRIAIEVEKIEGTLQSDLAFSRAREQALQASLSEAELATGEQNRESIQLRALEREAAANRALFETFLEQFKTASKVEGLNEAGARIISRAEVPGSPFYPDVQKQTMAFGFAGFVLAVLLILALEAINPGITNPEQAEKSLGSRALGILPRAGEKEAAHDVPLDKPQSSYVEALNTLLVSLSLTDPDHEPRTLQITSSIPEEGKTTLAISLARVLAGRDKKVLLVDGDLRRPSIEKKLNLKRSPKGLTDLVLSHGNDVNEYLSKDPRSEVQVLAPGKIEFVQAADIFASQRMRQLVAAMREHFDYVIFDAPPVMAVADARLIGHFVDKTLFVVRWNQTPVKVVKAALKLLREGHTEIAGIVLQAVDLKRYGRMGHGDSGYYYHYGRYGKYYSD